MWKAHAADNEAASRSVTKPHAVKPEAVEVAVVAGKSAQARLAPGWSRIMDFGKCRGYRNLVGGRVMTKAEMWRAHAAESASRPEELCDALPHAQCGSKRPKHHSAQSAMDMEIKSERQEVGPQALPPQTLPPQTLSPQTLPPQTLPAQTLQPQTLPPPRKKSRPPPLKRGHSVGRRVLVPSSCWPTYDCSEQGGRGWVAVIRRERANGLVLVRFVDARDARGVPYRNVWLCSRMLEPLHYCEARVRTLAADEGKEAQRWLCNGHPFLGVRVIRIFKCVKIGAIITKWLPASSEGDVPLFRALHDDGDEEDLEADEVQKAMRLQQVVRYEEFTAQSSVKEEPDCTSSQSSVKDEIGCISLSRLVGKRVRVFWEGDGVWYEGIAKRYSRRRGLLVQYDDGDFRSYCEDDTFQYECLD